MTFNMPEEWHARFKMRAAREGISMKTLLQRAFATYESETAAQCLPPFEKD